MRVSMYHVMAILVLPVLLNACATTAAMRSASAGQIGCPDDEVVVSNTKRDWGVGSWTATCRGHVFHCSAVGGDGGTQVKCKEELKSR